MQNQLNPIYTFATIPATTFGRTYLTSIIADLSTDVYTRHRSPKFYETGIATNVVKGSWFQAISCDHEGRLKYYEVIKETIRNYKMVLLISWSGTMLPEMTKDEFWKLSEQKISFNFANAQKNLSWVYYAHIFACIELDIPLMLYSFDPEIDSNFGINAMHSFIECPETFAGGGHSNKTRSAA